MNAKRIAFLLSLSYSLFYLCFSLEIEIEDGSNLHFRHVGDVAGTLSMTHLILSVNITQHMALVKGLCEIPKQIRQSTEQSLNVTRSQKRLLRDLNAHCRNLLESLKERESIWFNIFNQPDGEAREGRRPKVKRAILDALPWTENYNPFRFQSQVRPKRQVLIGMAVGAAVVAASSALYSAIEMEELSSSIYKQQQINIEILQDHETRLGINERSISLLNSTVTKIGLKLINMADYITINEVILHVAFSMNTAFDDVNRVVRGLNAIAMHRLSPDAVKTPNMARALASLRERMRNEGFTLGLTTFDDVFRSETSHAVFRNGTMVVIVHIPSYKVNTKLRLLEYVPVPIILDTPGKLQAGEKPVAIYAQPEHSYLAVTQDESAYKTFSHAELQACRELGGVHFCANDNVYRRAVQKSCLYGLFRLDADISGISAVGGQLLQPASGLNWVRISF
jgi:hypothetical protein